MNKKSIFFVLIFCFISALQAQLRSSVQVAAAIPAGYFEDVAEVGGGSTLNLAYYPLNANLEFSLSSGYYICGFKENLPGYTFRYSGVPVLAGIRFNFTDFDFIPYAGLEAGIFFDRYLVTIDYGILGKFSTETTAVNPALAPYIGFRMNLSPVLDLDVNAKYQRINTQYYPRAYILIQTGIAVRII